jgi:hypothetical protein
MCLLLVQFQNVVSSCPEHHVSQSSLLLFNAEGKIDAVVLRRLLWIYFVAFAG